MTFDILIAIMAGFLGISSFFLGALVLFLSSRGK